MNEKKLCVASNRKNNKSYVKKKTSTLTRQGHLRLCGKG